MLAIKALLHSRGLPVDGAEEHLEDFVVALDAEVVVGTAALEPYGEIGLLRSVAVRSDQSNKGLGSRLTSAIIEKARARNVSELYLLTTTASEFFPRFGFERVERGSLPDALAASREFQGACPASAVPMRLVLTTAQRLVRPLPPD